MVYRIFVEKKKELANEARAILSDINNLLGIKSVSDIRLLNRYDVENIDEIQKIIADSGYCSRRRAEQYIQNGEVKVNGRPCSIGDKADPRNDLITVNGEKIQGKQWGYYPNKELKTGEIKISIFVYNEIMGTEYSAEEFMSYFEPFKITLSEY